MEIKEQSGLRQVLAGTPLPKMCKVRQIFKRDGIEDVPAYLQKKLDNPKLRARIKPGMRVVLTGSSRQIANMSVILRKLAQFVKEQGAQPYIIPAMGSHGGATDEGQRQILESYGITEEFCGCPIFSSMETVRVGELPNGDEVRVDKFAHDADAVIVVGRIKAHTAFRGPYESGLIKMMAIGMGKRAGADSLHSAGFGEMGERLPLYAKVVFDSCNIIFGVAPIENEFDQTCRIEVIPAEEIFDKENLRDKLALVVGGRDVTKAKPDPEGLNFAVDRLKADKADVLFCGDTVIDAEAARRAGVDFCAVLNGITPAEAFAEYPHVYIAPNLASLQNWLAG